CRGTQKISAAAVRMRGHRGAKYSRAGAVRLWGVLWIAVPPGKSFDGDAQPARADGEVFAAGEHVHSGREGVHAAARGTARRRSKLDGCGVLPERTEPGEDAVPRRVRGGLPRR